jgi:hypothetical protein
MQENKVNYDKCFKLFEKLFGKRKKMYTWIDNKSYDIFKTKCRIYDPFADKICKRFNIKIEDFDAIRVFKNKYKQNGIDKKGVSIKTILYKICDYEEDKNISLMDTFRDILINGIERIYLFEGDKETKKGIVYYNFSDKLVGINKEIEKLKNRTYFDKSIALKYNKKNVNNQFTDCVFDF